MREAVRIEPGVVGAAVAHARESFPWECCGFLIGDRERIRACVRAENRARRTDRFEMGLEAWFEAWKAGVAGEIVGVYHSHPAGSVGVSNVDYGLGESGVGWGLVVTAGGEWRLVEG